MWFEKFWAAICMVSTFPAFVAMGWFNWVPSNTALGVVAFVALGMAAATRYRVLSRS